jgi:hypothetical protein
MSSSSAPLPTPEGPGSALRAFLAPYREGGGGGLR